VALRNLLGGIVVAGITGCGILSPDGGVRSELEENRERWEGARPTSYSVTVERLCFCGPDWRGPVRIRVEGATAVERVYVDSGLPVGADAAPFFPTVDGLFQVILDALDRDAHEIRVSYDPGTGIPFDIWIDYEENTVDEELGFTVVLPIET
jgi:hypothetical protein